jgi:hypothetical protein
LSRARPQRQRAETFRETFAYLIKLAAQHRS